jgi:hypothetical protein
MAEQKERNKSKERAAFVAEHAELLRNCCSSVSRERKEHLRELVTKARSHFGYSEKTIAQDIVRPLVRAYSKLVAQQKDKQVPARLHLRSGSGDEAPGERGAHVRQQEPVRRDH